MSGACPVRPTGTSGAGAAGVRRMSGSGVTGRQLDAAFRCSFGDDYRLEGDDWMRCDPGRARRKGRRREGCALAWRPARPSSACAPAFAGCRRSASSRDCGQQVGSTLIGRLNPTGPRWTSLAARWNTSTLASRLPPTFGRRRQPILRLRGIASRSIRGWYHCRGRRLVAQIMEKVSDKVA